jgi:hypothetical protein
MIYELTESQMDGMGKMYQFFNAPQRVGMEFKIDIGPTHGNGSVHIATLSGKKIGEYLNGVYGEGKYGPDGKDILNGIRKVYIEEFGKDSNPSFTQLFQRRVQHLL